MPDLSCVTLKIMYGIEAFTGMGAAVTVASWLLLSSFLVKSSHSQVAACFYAVFYLHSALFNHFHILSWPCKISSCLYNPYLLFFCDIIKILCNMTIACHLQVSNFREEDPGGLITLLYMFIRDFHTLPLLVTRDNEGTFSKKWTLILKSTSTN